MTGHGITLKRLHEFKRFLIVGTASAILNTAIIILLTEGFGLHYLVSYAICFVCVTLFGFLLNRDWSFRVKNNYSKQKAVNRYFLVTILATVVAMGISERLVALGLSYQVAVFLSAGAMAPFNFVFHRIFSFGLTGVGDD